MYATLRQYKGITPALFATLMSHQAELEGLIRQTVGFVQYDLVRTRDGVMTLTVCTDRLGTEVSNFTVAAWIEQHVPAMKATAPVISGGEHVVHLATSRRAAFV
ncbi:MAG: hypothetical protein ACJ789_17235 [Thermomicrobiales bacterium]